MDAAITLQPQPGPQTEFLATPADIAIYGGAAGGGKSFGLLLECLRHYQNPRFGWVIFRRTTKDVRNQGGLWDESMKVFIHVNGRPRESTLTWRFPSGSTGKFDHLEYEKNVLSWQGAQIPYIGFDELTHFTHTQFFYMLSRNRSDSGVPGKIRATCNPDPDSWVRDFIDWWIDDKGFAIPERSGKLRYFIRKSDILHWADSKEELIQKFGPTAKPKSLTFIPAKIFDNQILMQTDPSYIANLEALSLVDRGRLLDANWNIKPTAGNIFRREWFKLIDHVPGGWMSVVRFWDRAATIPNDLNKDPDWTRGIKLYRYPNDTFLVADLKSERSTPGAIESLIKNVAAHDGVLVPIRAQQDPGSAGVYEAENFMRQLMGYDVNTSPFFKDKLTRAKPVSAQVERGAFFVLKGPWNEEFFKEVENFPEAPHDDIVDALSGAFNELITANSFFDVQHLYMKR